MYQYNKIKEILINFKIAKERKKEGKTKNTFCGHKLPILAIKSYHFNNKQQYIMVKNGKIK